MLTINHCHQIDFLLKYVIILVISAGSAGSHIPLHNYNFSG